MDVIYIHGIGAQAPEQQWKRSWDLALFGKEMGQRTVPAYWSDILHGDEGEAHTKQIRAMRKARFSTDAARTEREEPVLKIDQLVAEAKVPKTRREEANRQLTYLAEELTRTTVAVGRTGRRRGSSANALPLPGFLRRPITKLFLEQFIKDVAAYFYREGARIRIQDRVRAQIKAAKEPFVLVSHSLGTVIAFEVLSQLRADKVCSLFVTLGSPLGITEVQDTLSDFGNRPQVPEQVRGWHNFADRLDPVAADASLANDYPQHNQAAEAARVIDHMIINERTARLRGFNPHSSEGYLAHPEVRTAVHRQIGFDSAARFLVARDVAEEFVDPLRRVRVLIEVLEPGYEAVDETPKMKLDRERAQATKFGVARAGSEDGDEQGSPRVRAEADFIPLDLDERINRLKREVVAIATEETLGSQPAKTAAVKLGKEIGAMALRKYVSANLLPAEINRISARHSDLNVYAVWRNSPKRKNLDRSHHSLKVSAGRTSYGALGEEIIWAVLDTGVCWGHPHFRANDTIMEAWDCTTTADTPDLLYSADEHRGRNDRGSDRDGHGTHVCGIIAGGCATYNGSLSGIAPRARLIVYKVLDDDGNGDDAWIIKAVDHIFRQNQSRVSGLKVHGVNLSLGGPFDATVYGCGFSPICKELRDLWRQGTLVCVAAGNEGRINIPTDDGGFDLNTQLSIGDPANLEDCIAVGSINADKPYLYGVSWFSSRGPTADGRWKPDVVAPGERILSCSSNFEVSPKWKPHIPASYQHLDRDKLYRHESGTSMACPHVSGLLAAFLSVRKEFRGQPDEVKKILLENCNDLGRDRYHQGAGMPNLMRMLTNS